MSDATFPLRPAMEMQANTYSEEETVQLYELARRYFETGDHRAAETMAAGLCEVAPSFMPAWLLLCCVQLLNHSDDAALSTANQALRLDPNEVSAQLVAVAAMLAVNDFTSAGSLLGEVGERIQRGQLRDPLLIKFYGIQLGRYRHQVG